MDILDFPAAVWAVILIVFGLFVIVPWAKSKGAKSVFAHDDSLEDVGITLVSMIGDDGGKQLVDGRRELRPPFGYRALAPAILLGFLLGYDYREIMTLMGIVDPQHQNYAIWAFWALFAYTIFELNFRQRVIYDRNEISCWGVDLRRQDRDLGQLVDISMHENRPALVLIFADGKRFYVPKHLTGRARFIEDMEKIAAENLRNGAEVPSQGFFARQGF